MRDHSPASHKCKSTITASGKTETAHNLAAFRFLSLSKNSAHFAPATMRIVSERPALIKNYEAARNDVPGNICKRFDSAVPVPPVHHGGDDAGGRISAGQPAGDHRGILHKHNKQSTNVTVTASRNHFYQSFLQVPQRSNLPTTVLRKGPTHFVYNNPNVQTP